jgi:uncharacterized protein DUF6916
MFLHQGVLAAAACATTPLLARSNGPIGGDDQTRVIPSPNSGSGGWEDQAAAFDLLGRGQFSNAIGTSFKVTIDGGAQPVFVTLTAVNDLPALAQANAASFAVPNHRSAVATTTAGFMLLFWSSSPLPQGTHLFQHAGLGSFALFTVPAGNGQQAYVATVNRLDQAIIVAVPLDQPNAGANAAATPVAPATSSGIGIPPRAPSGTPVVRRGGVRD